MHQLFCRNICSSGSRPECSPFVTKKGIFIISVSYCSCSTISESMCKVLLISNHLYVLGYFKKRNHFSQTIIIQLYYPSQHKGPITLLCFLRQEETTLPWSSVLGNQHLKILTQMQTFNNTVNTKQQKLLIVLYNYRANGNCPLRGFMSLI